MASIAVQIKFDRAVLYDAIGYFQSLGSSTFHKQAKKHFESHEAQQTVLQRGREIVQRHVYDVYEPYFYSRTFKLYQSTVVDVDVSQAAMGSIALYSDPSIAEAKLLSGYSYAAFFIKPVEFKTFIKPRGVASAPVNFRPFFLLWEHYMERFSLPHARDSVVEAMDDLLPLSMRKK